MLWSCANIGKAEFLQKAPDTDLPEIDAKPFLDDAFKIDTAPTHHAVLHRVRASHDYRAQLLFLRLCQLRRPPRRGRASSRRAWSVSCDAHARLRRSTAPSLLFTGIAVPMIAPESIATGEQNHAASCQGIPCDRESGILKSGIRALSACRGATDLDGKSQILTSFT